MKSTLKHWLVEHVNESTTVCYQEVSKEKDTYLDIEYQKMPNVIANDMNTIYVSLKTFILLNEKKVDFKFNQLFPSSETKRYEDIKKNEPFFLRLILRDDFEYLFLAIKLIDNDE